MIFIKEYYISIDGGGSKTEVCVMNVKTEHIQTMYYDGININQIGETVFTTRMCEIFDTLPLTESYYICLGIPGYGEASETDRTINNIMAKYLVDDQYEIVNDVKLAHYASFAMSDGILLLSGTGSMALSIDNGLVQRSGGWGFLIGDEGSAFSIGLKAINHLSKVFDGIEKPTILYELVCDKYNFDFASKLISFVYSSNNYRKEIAVISKLVDEAAIKGCPKALEILSIEAMQLAKLVKVLDDGNDLKISYAGSVFNSQILKKFVEEHGDFKFEEPVLKPVLGGILRGYVFENAKNVDEEILNRLKIDYKN